MQQQSASFWSDIKHFEERLAEDTDSYLFAQLAVVYLKVHLVDDALHTARQGVAKFPDYVAGQRALAMACHAKGLVDECRRVLEKVTAAVPEDAEAQKMLARLLVDCGECDAAKKIFQVLLSFYPQDVESLEELNMLEQPAPIPFEDSSACVFEKSVVELHHPDEDEMDDEIICLTEDDIWVEELETPVLLPSAQHDPLSTATLAELYVQQGFVSKALEIYHALHNEDPTNAEVQSRIADLEGKETSAAVVDTYPVVLEPDPVIMFPESSALPPDIPAQGRADEAIITLEGWLDTIRRIKACR